MLTGLRTTVYLQVYPEGRMSQVMDKLNIGDKLLFKGPRGDFSLELNEKREIGQELANISVTFAF